VATAPAASWLMAAVDDLDETIRQIRTAIFGLDRPPDAAGGDVRARVADVSASATRALGIEPTLRLDGPIETLVPGAEAYDILAVVREGLANVARHAGARVVTVDIVAKDGRATVTVDDDERDSSRAGASPAGGWPTCAAGQRTGAAPSPPPTAPSGGAELRCSVPLRLGD
jgi:signal transduction histidine kinase